MTKTADTIKTLRENKKLTQAELAKKLGYHTQFISNIERGMCLIPGEQISAFAEALGVHKNKLVTPYLEDHLEKAKESIK